MRNLFFLLVISNNYSWAQNLVVHEWGTFTAKYNDVGLPYAKMNTKVEEPLPNFVNKVNFKDSSIVVTTYNEIYKVNCSYYGYNLELQNDLIKMETPIIYFYAEQAINDIDVTVQFNNGSISEYYPMPFKYEGPENLLKYAEKKFNGNEYNGGFNLDFKKYNGFAKWKVNVLASKDNKLCTYKSETVPEIWQAPRNTQANIIECMGQQEKYIFYRGLGGFQNPLIPKYTQNGALQIENTLNEPISFMLIYEKLADGLVNIWDVTSLNAKDNKIIINKKITITESTWHTSYRKEFENKLVENGLFADEAKAMLSTWEKSYFGTLGVKIFYIVPSKFIDSILPLTISAPVQDMRRVMVGRTEIDNFNKDSTYKYVANKYSDSFNIGASENSFIILPNPITNNTVYISNNTGVIENTTIEVSTANGTLLFKDAINIYPGIPATIALDKVLPRGILYCTIYWRNKRLTKKVLCK